MPFRNTKILLANAFIAALALSGCEFGNKNKTTLTGYDTISGYYASLPQSVVFRAKVGSAAERVRSGTVNQMPAFLKAVMKNPTMLYYDDPIQKIGSIRAHADTSVGFPTQIDESLGTFGVSTGAYAEISGCRFEQEIDNSGTFAQAASTTVIAGMPVRGTLALDYSIRYSFIGDDIDCNAMRAAFQSCYNDDVGCSTNASSIFYRPFVQQVYDPLVQSGTITDAEIGAASSLGYTATYR